MLLTLAIISLLLFLFAPQEYSYSYSLYCFIVFLLSTITMLLRNCKDSFLRYEFIFIIAFFFTNYVYSLVYYPVNPYFSLFNLPYNEAYITKGLALSTVGGCLFNLGVYNRKKIFMPQLMPLKTKCLAKPTIIMNVMLVLFIPSLFSMVLLGIYTTEYEHSLLNTVLMYVIYYYIFASFYNIDPECKNKKKAIISEFGILPLVLISTYVLLFLLIGSRTVPMRIVFLVVVLYNIYIRKLSKKFTVVMIVIGMLVLAYIGMTREGESEEMTSLWDISSEMVINNRSLYVLMEYYDINGPTFGRTMLMSILAIIPFMQSIFLGVTGWHESDISSGNLVTHLFYKDIVEYDRIVGLGTNVIGDIYVAFGLIGVVIIMYLFGKIIRSMHEKALINNRYYYKEIVIYSLLFMNVVYMTHSTILGDLRCITWVLAIMYLFNRKKRLY